MTRRRDLLVSFLLAVSIHVLIAAGMGNLWGSDASEMLIAFQRGESGLELTLVSVPAPEVPLPPPPVPEVAVQAPPERIFTEPESDIEPVAPEPEPEPEPEPPAPEPEQEVAEPEPDKPETTEPNPGIVIENNGDLLEKGVEDPLRLGSDVRVVYPLGARLRGEEGTVIIMVSADASAQARSATVIQSSGYLSLDHAALKAVRKAEFMVSRGGNKPREDEETTLTIRFRLLD